MKRKINLFLFVAILALLFSLVFAGTAFAADIFVPSGQPTIQAAVAAAAPGDIIHVAAGTYNETGQIVINKNLTITGAGAASTIVNKAEDTGDSSSGDLRAWVIVTGGNSLNLSRLTLDGAGRKICIAVMTKAGAANTANIEDCGIKNIAWDPNGGPPSYYGRGFCNYGTGTSKVRGCTLSGIGRIGVFTYGTTSVSQIELTTYIGKGPGDWLDYAFEAGGGGQMNVTSCNISNCNASGSGWGSAGILVTTYFAPGTAATITGCTFTNCDVDISVGYDGSDTSSVTAHYNNFSGTSAGVYNTNAANIVDAENNWWGDASGPSGVGPGTGVPVSSGVDYTPWLTALQVVTGANTYMLIALALMSVGLGVFMIRRRNVASAIA